MKKIIISFSLLLMFLSFCRAQAYTGRLIDEQGVPVEYANVGVVGKSIGTVTSRDGRFELEIPQERFSDSIRFSMIGYETVTLLVSDFVNRTNKTIVMKEKIYSIEPITITATTIRTMILGYDRANWQVVRLYPRDDSNNRGLEFGIILDPKRETVLLETLTLNEMFITKEGNDTTILYRLNLYKVNPRNNFENIMEKPVYIRAPKNITRFEIDISEHNFIIENKTLLTLEYIDDAPLTFSLHFRGGFPKPPDDSFFRRASHSNWINTVCFGMSVKARIMQKNFTQK